MPDWGSVEFKWPFMLWALGIWPLCLGLSWYRRRHTTQLPWRFMARPSAGVWLLEALGLAFLLLALARPQAVLLQAMRDAAVMLVIDTSASMKAEDVPPNRLEAARRAAHHFIETKPGLLQVGVVSVGGTAALAQVPTLQSEDLRRSLDDLTWQNGSALGTGLVIALDTLLPQAGIDAQKIIDAANENPRAALPKNSNPPVAKNPTDPPQDPRERVISDGRSKAIVLITDGQGNMGPDLLNMAELAAQHKVRVHVVGVGTTQGALVREKGMSMRTRLEEDVLRKVAQVTLGEYRRAEQTSQLMKVYDDLGHKMKFEKRGVSEVTHWVGMLGMALVLLAAVMRIRRAGHLG